MVGMSWCDLSPYWNWFELDGGNSVTSVELLKRYYYHIRETVKKVGLHSPGLLLLGAFCLLPFIDAFLHAAPRQPYLHRKGLFGPLYTFGKAMPHAVAMMCCATWTTFMNRPHDHQAIRNSKGRALHWLGKLVWTGEIKNFMWWGDTKVAS